MINFKRPMLAASLLKPTDKHDDATILAAMRQLKRWPKAASFKEDGIRGIKKQNLLSRKLKLIPNIRLRQKAIILPPGFDCELSNRDLEYYQIESIVMSQVHPNWTDIKFYVLDWFIEHEPYLARLEKAIIWCKDNSHPDIVPPSYRICETPEALFAYEKEVIEMLGEGICFRPINSLYLQKNTIDNRSTLSEEVLVKLARMVRQEVTILGCYEQEENANGAQYDALGGMDRSSCKANMYGKDTLGGFHVVTNTGIEFDVGTGVGLTDRIRKEIWEQQRNWIGTKIVIKHKACGQKIRPRSPIYLGPRKEIDIV
jgi:hypothetical protein